MKGPIKLVPEVWFDVGKNKVVSEPLFLEMFNHSASDADIMKEGRAYARKLHARSSSSFIHGVIVELRRLGGHP